MIRNLIMATVLAALMLYSNHSYAQPIELTVDQSQSSVTADILGMSDASSITGTGEIELVPPEEPFGTAQFTDYDVLLADGFEITFLGTVTASAEPGAVSIFLVNPGPAGPVDMANQFDQPGNEFGFAGLIDIDDPFLIVGGDMTIDLADEETAFYDIEDAQLAVDDDQLTVTIPINLQVPLFDAVTLDISGEVVLTGSLSVPSSSIGVRRGNLFFLDSNGNGMFDMGVDEVFSFGLASDDPLVGDWNGDGTTDLGVRRGNLFILDSNGNGTFDMGVDEVFSFGLASDDPLVGDWNGDGTTDLGVRRGNLFILDSNGNGTFDMGVDEVLSFGLASDDPVVGDWNGDGTTDLGVRRGNLFFLDSNGNGTFDMGVDEVLSFGLASDDPVVGDWNGDGTTDLGVRRGNLFFLDSNGNGTFDMGVDEVFSFGLASDDPVVGVWQ